MKDHYSTYLCKHDHRPVLTFERLRDFQNPIRGTWNQYIDVHSAIRDAESAGYKIPNNMAKDYDGWLLSRRLREIECFYDSGMPTFENKKRSWLERLVAFIGRH